MKQWIGLIGWTLVLLALVAGPVSAEPESAGGAGVQLAFTAIPQGHTGFVYVSGPDLVEVRAVFQERFFVFYPEDGQFVGLLSADMAAKAGEYTLQVWVKYADGTAERIDKPVTVSIAGFGRSDVMIAASLMPLLQPEVEQAEFDKLFHILTRYTPEQYWVGGFMAPSAEEIIGWFGAYRLYNSTFWSQHTGLDYRVPPNSPVPASAAGRVMLAEPFAIRGNYVLIDHGWGIYTGYAHFTEILVVPGQWVKQGDIIGLSGTTGRSSGAHLHWEVAVGGAWVDPEDFLALGLTVAPETTP